MAVLAISLLVVDVVLFIILLLALLLLLPLLKMILLIRGGGEGGGEGGEGEGAIEDPNTLYTLPSRRGLRRSWMIAAVPQYAIISELQR